MLAKRIIPCLDVKNGRVVKGRSFVNLRDAGDPVECGKQYSDAGADELVFLDITATLEARKTILELAARVAEEVFIPFTIGGGISTIDDARGLLSAGAEKISINTAAVKNKPLITEVAEAFGNQAVVVAIDAKRVGSTGVPPVLPGETPVVPKTPVTPSWEVYINAGTTPTGIDVIQWSRQVESLGAGEIMLTSIDSDGHTAGYDIELNAAVNEAVSIPVIASGGAGGPEDMLAVLTKGKADAALAASIFHYGTYSIAEVKEYLRSHGVHVRS
ncbi:MAG: imidazole glycerol phosphate synthase subunit HisF [Planctomycetota bacterium]|nr:imidazole glycerol phosphate synthase subunit HisF [Planctomycetota bacterium]